MLRTDRLDVWPINNVPGVVANQMNPSHVDAVFIAGKPKKWRGAMVGVDTARVLKLAQQARDDLMRRADHKLDLMA
jgi:hypothetical protein